MIIIKYSYIIYIYSRAHACRLTAFCINLTYNSDFTVPTKLPSRSARLFREFSSLEEWK